VCTAVPVVNNVATCTVPPASAAFGVGSHTITLASFGDTNYTLAAIPPSASLSFTVVKAPTTITFSPAPSPTSSVPGQPVTFYATVAVPLPGLATPTGSVAFIEDTTGGP